MSDKLERDAIAFLNAAEVNVESALGRVRRVRSSLAEQKRVDENLLSVLNDLTLSANQIIAAFNSLKGIPAEPR